MSLMKPTINVKGCVNMKDNDIRTAVCPLCGRTYSEHPALSRVDDNTPICPDCGRQALESIGISPEEQEKIIATMHRYDQKP